MPGDWQPFTVTYARPLAGDDVRVMAAASDDLVPPPQGTVPAVPVVLGANRHGFMVMARNSDVASGVTAPVTLRRGGGSDRQLIDVAFDLPFSAPPVVVFCATDQGLPPFITPPAAAGWVESVGTDGFRLAALNTDSVGVPTAYYWVALGCGPACGSRTLPAPPSTVIKPPSTIHIPFPFMWVGASQWATAVDAEGRAWEAERFEWSSSQPEVATVFADGRIQARKPGQAVLMARGEGGEAKVELEVRAAEKRS